MAQRNKGRKTCDVCGKSYTPNSLGWHRREVHGIYVRGPKAQKTESEATTLMQEIVRRDANRPLRLNASNNGAMVLHPAPDIQVVVEPSTGRIGILEWIRG